MTSSFIPREEEFICLHCEQTVKPLGSGTYRDHCPTCLYSRHVDRDGPGDRFSTCLGLLQPTGIDQDSKKGFVIVYQCEKCGKSHRNKAAPDDEIIQFMENSQREN